MSSGALSLEPVDPLSPAAMPGLQQIYEGGFPPNERADFATLTTQRRDDEVALALASDGQPYGFALLRPLGGTGWMYLRYLVVDGARRSQGLGGQLWELLTARLRGAGYTLLGRGGDLLPVPGYRTPAVAPGHTDWLPMRLMVTPLTTPPPAGDPAAVVEAVYRFRWDLEPGQFPAVTYGAR